MNRGDISLKRPLVPLAVIYVIATVVGFMPSGGSFIVPSVIISIFFAVFAILKKKYRYLFSFLAVAFFAFSRAICFYQPLVHAENDFLEKFLDKDVRATISGEISFIRSVTTNDYGRVKYEFSLKDVSFRARGNPQKISKPIAVYWSTPVLEKDGGTTIKPGMNIELSGFVFKRLYSDSGNLSIDDLYVVSGSYASRILDDRKKYPEFLSDFKEKSAKLLSSGLDRYPDERDLILAMTLGIRSSVSKEMMENFRKAGTIHLFAISGLHVGVIAVIIVWLISFFGVTRRFLIIPLMPLLIAYVCMTGMQASACRAALMIIIHYGALLFNRKPDIFGSLAATVVILLLLNPLQITDLSFILSVMMVLGIILYTGPVHRLCKRITRIDYALKESKMVFTNELNGDKLARVRRWPKDFFVKFANFLLTCFSGAFAAGLVSFPLTAYFFGLLTPYSVIANMFAVPVSPFLMAAAGFVLFISYIFPPTAFVANYLTAFLAWIMKSISAYFASLPFSSFRTDFPLWAMIVWYVALFLLFRGISGILDPIINTTDSEEEMEDL